MRLKLELELIALSTAACISSPMPSFQQSQGATVNGSTFLDINRFGNVVRVGPDASEHLLPYMADKGLMHVKGKGKVSNYCSTMFNPKQCTIQVHTVLLDVTQVLEKNTFVTSLAGVAESGKQRIVHS
jgi:hypothetical protein